MAAKRLFLLNLILLSRLAFVPFYCLSQIYLHYKPVLEHRRRKTFTFGRLQRIKLPPALSRRRTRFIHGHAARRDTQSHMELG